MNEIIRTRKATATMAIVSLNAAFAVRSANWPADYPTYVTQHSIPTYSFFKRSLADANANRSHEFADAIASIFASLSKGQESLGPDFEAAWDSNVDILYQS